MACAGAGDRAADCRPPYPVRAGSRGADPAAGLRAELDDRTESISRKIRDAELRKIQYMAVVGDREQAAGEIALREHRKGDEGSFPVEAFIQRLDGEVKARAAR